MKQVMKSKANLTATGGNNWMWGLAGYYSAARAASRSGSGSGYVIIRKLSETGRRSWVWSGAGFKNLTRAGGK